MILIKGYGVKKIIFGILKSSILRYGVQVEIYFGTWDFAYICRINTKLPSPLFAMMKLLNIHN